jgi:hypothetical protein
MAETESATPMSIKARISALNLEQVGATPGAPTPYTYEQVSHPRKARPPPPPPPSQKRSVSTNNPPVQSNATTKDRSIGNEPAGPPLLPKRPTPENSMELGINGGTDQTPAGGRSPNIQPTLPPRSASQTASQPGPPLPLRTSTQPSPALPPRRPSEDIGGGGRRQSIESVSSIASRGSSVSGISTRTNLSGVSNSVTGQRQFEIKAPAYDPSKLPPLPPKRDKEEKKPIRSGLTQSKSTPAVPQRTVKAPLPPPMPARSPNPETKLVTEDGEPARRTLPPPMPPRRPTEPLPETESDNIGCLQSAPQNPVPQTRPIRSALSFAMNKTTEIAPSMPSRPISETPPPVPISSRPNLAEIIKSKPILNPSATPSFHDMSVCLICRDFSSVDAHAARFPRDSIPSHDLGWLAQQLTAPFPSHTDKARALFTWLHHNIAYNTEAFWSGNVKPSTPNSTLATGLAVCEGYAGLFTALASKAGLESVVVGGHGKGVGFSALKKGERVPPYDGNHAWNAVRIDRGEWKLIDCCWGAGAVNGTNQPYTKRFAPERFTQSNEIFGIDHFPEDRRHFHRADGRALDWEEYMLQDAIDPVLGGKAVLYTGEASELVGKDTIRPEHKNIRLSINAHEPTVRFCFAAPCPHWDILIKHGNKTPHLYILSFGDEMLPLSRTESNIGTVWWVDVPRSSLRKTLLPSVKNRGEVSVVAMTSFGNGKYSGNARGLSADEFLKGRGRTGMSWTGVIAWQVVE